MLTGIQIGQPANFFTKDEIEEIQGQMNIFDFVK